MSNAHTKGRIHHLIIVPSPIQLVFIKVSYSGHFPNGHLLVANHLFARVQPQPGAMHSPNPPFPAALQCSHPSHTVARSCLVFLDATGNPAFFQTPNSFTSLLNLFGELSLGEDGGGTTTGAKSCLNPFFTTLKTFMGAYTTLMPIAAVSKPCTYGTSIQSETSNADPATNETTTLPTTEYKPVDPSTLRPKVIVPM